MKKIILTLIGAMVIAGMAVAGDKITIRETIVEQDTLTKWFDVPKFSVGVNIYIEAIATPPNASNFDTAWVSIYTRHFEKADSLIEVVAADIDTFLYNAWFPADSLAKGTTLDYQWGSQLGIRFVVRDSTGRVAGQDFTANPYIWRAEINGY